MQSDIYTKRDWIYGGISHPAGVVVARSGRRTIRLRPNSKLLVLGDEHALGLAPSLHHLSRAVGVSLAVDAEPGAHIERWLTPERIAKVKASQPTVVLVSLGMRGPAATLMPILSGMSGALRGVGSTVLWLRPPDAASPATKALRVLLRAACIPSFHSECTDVHLSVTGRPSARGYAGWSGAIWRWIG